MNRPSIRFAIARDLEEHPEIEHLPAILGVARFNGREYEVENEHCLTLRAAMQRAYELPWDENTFVMGVAVESGKYTYPLGAPWQVSQQNDFEWYWKHRLGKK
jgi:hypothetical protein